MQIKDLIPWTWGRRETAMTRGESPDPMSALQGEINRAFEGFWRSFEAPLMRTGFTPTMGGGEIQPRVEVAETDKEIEVTAELPGMDEKDIEVSVTRDALTIKGEKRSEREEKRRDYHLTERSYGAIQRTIPLPADVDTDKVNASFKNGVLKVSIPKTAQLKAETKRIAVKKE